MASSELTLSLESLAEQESPACRFCGCTEFKPCGIYIFTDENGVTRLARAGDHQLLVEVISCAWYLPGVCNAPECVARLIEERGQSMVVLYGADGKRVA